MKRRVLIVLVLTGLPLTLSAANPSDAQIEKWIKQLNSDRFAVRENATRQLASAGAAAIDALAEQIAGSSVEASLRGLTVLRELALQENRDAVKAEQVIKELAANRATATSQRAATVLASLHQIRTARGVKILRRLGATFTYNGVSFDEPSLSGAVIYVTFGKTWRGTIDDLVYVSWLKGYRGIHITFFGERYTDDWLAKIASQENILSLQLNRTGMTDAGLKQLARMNNLQALSLRYCKLSDASLEHIDARMETLVSLSVFGSGISKDAFDKMVSRHDRTNTRYGRGGFLGVGGPPNQNGQAGCYITTVTPNQAAARAGIRKGDIITKYDGQPVTEFIRVGGPVKDENQKRQPTLSELIGSNAPGAKVKITLERNGVEMVKDVVLGEWP